MENLSHKKDPAVTAVIFVLVVAVVAAGIFLWNNRELPSVGGEKDAHGCLVAAGYSWCEARQACERSWEKYCTATPPKTVIFGCDGGKTVTASFYPGDDAFVDLVLNDGRMYSVPRALSASGARYANTDETFVFWNKGDTAFITEGANSTTTFSNCTLSAE